MSIKDSKFVLLPLRLRERDRSHLIFPTTRTLVKKSLFHHPSLEAFQKSRPNIASLCPPSPSPTKSERTKRRTRTVLNTCHPQWNQSFIFSPFGVGDLRSHMLEVTVWDYDRLGANEFLGEVTIDLASAHLQQQGGAHLAEDQAQATWHALNTYPTGSAAAFAAAAAAEEAVGVSRKKGERDMESSFVLWAGAYF